MEAETGARVAAAASIVTTSSWAAGLGIVVTAAFTRPVQALMTLERPSGEQF